MAGTPANAIDITTTGVVYFNSSVFQSLTPGAAGTVLTSTGSTAPTWQSPSSITLSAIGSTPNANGGVISGNVLTLEPAGTGFGGLISSGTQSFSGVKTFNSVPIITALTGVVTSDGASGLTASVVTQHDVLVGGVTNAIVSVSPSTAGFVLTSNGLSADPSFQANSAISGIVTINGDTGSITGTTTTINAGNSSRTCGASVKFTSSTATSVLNVSDSFDNTFIGFQSGSTTPSSFSTGNTGVGVNSLTSLDGSSSELAGLSNVAVGIK